MLGGHLPEPLRTWWAHATAIEETWGVLRWLASIATMVVIVMAWLLGGSEVASGLASVIVATVSVFFGMTFYGWYHGWNMPASPLILPWQRKAELERKRQRIAAFYKMVDEAEADYKAERGHDSDQFDTLICKIIPRKADYHRLAPYLSDELKGSISLSPGRSINIRAILDETWSDAVLRVMREEIARLEQDWGLLEINPSPPAPFDTP